MRQPAAYLAEADAEQGWWLHTSSHEHVLPSLHRVLCCKGRSLPIQLASILLPPADAQATEVLGILGCGSAIKPVNSKL